MLLALLLAVVAQVPSPRDMPRSSNTAAGTIGGVVVTDEPHPRPLRRARVTLNGASLDVGHTVITADDGAFAFTDLSPGRYQVTVEKDAYLAVANGSWRAAADGQRLTLAAREQKRLEFRLERGAVITGTIFDIDGTPMQGVDVRAYERHFFGVTGEYRYLEVGAVSLPTDDRGAYRIFGLPPGEYFVAASPPAVAAAPRLRLMGRDDRSYVLSRVFYPSTADPARATRVAVRAGEERSGIDVQMQYLPLASISGAVSMPPGHGDVEVAVFPVLDAGAPDATAASATLAGTDQFTFHRLAPGRYRVIARAVNGSASLAASLDLTIDGEDVDNVVLSLQPTLTISGMIVFRGDSPIPVFARSSAGPPLAGALRGAAMPSMDVDGVRFRIQGIVPGPFRLGTSIRGLRAPIAGWWLTSIAAGGVQLLDTPFSGPSPVEDAMATFSDHVSTVEGAVSGADGTPHANVSVIAFSRDRAAWFFQSWRIAAASTDDDGRYVIRNLPPGDYFLAVARDLVPSEWYDPAVLERLAVGAMSLTVAGAETQSHNLVIR